MNFNRYVYVGNNPYKYVDPDGRAGSCDMCYFGGSLPAGTNGPAYAAAQAQLMPVAVIGIAAVLTGPAIIAGIAEAGAGLAVAGSVAATGEIAGATQIAAAALTPAVETAAAIATDGVVGGAAASNVMYHYTDAAESFFASGLRAGSSVTDELFDIAATASQKLGIPVPSRIIPIVDNGQFVPNRPAIVSDSNRFTGGGRDFVNPEKVASESILPAIPIKDR